MEPTPELLYGAIESLLNRFFDKDEPFSYPCCSVFSMGEWHYGAVDPGTFERLNDVRELFRELGLGELQSGEG